MLFFLLFWAQIALAHNRSLLRPQEPIPEVVTCWADNPVKQYSLRDSHLESGPLFQTFDKNYFDTHRLPAGNISYRNQPKHTVRGSQLAEAIEQVVAEIFAKKKRFANFVILKDVDFNYGNLSGCIILRFRNHPFVLKLFIENPKSFVHPYSKGIEPSCFFIMGGGIMRHLTGFTRISNLEDIKTLVAQDPYWSKVIDTPRKWFWAPVKQRWIGVVGTNMGTQKVQRTQLPSIYGIIADEIKITKKVTLLQSEQALRCMRFCQFTQYRIDPHIQNFRIEKETGKLVLIDTENFRALVGLKDRFVVDSYFDWYVRLTTKCLNDKFFRNKEDRRLAQLVDWKEYTS